MGVEPSPNPAPVMEPVMLDASGSWHGHPDRAIVNYEWGFGDGYVGSGQVVSHAYAAPGPYAVILTVTDNNAPPRVDSTSSAVSIE